MLHPEPRPVRRELGDVHPGVRHRHPHPAVAHRGVHGSVRGTHGDRLALPRAGAARHDGAVAAEDPPGSRVSHRCGGPPLRDEGVVPTRLPGLHGPTRAVALTRVTHQRPGVSVVVGARPRRLLPVPALLGRPHPVRARGAVPHPVHVAVVAMVGSRPAGAARATAVVPAVQAEPLRPPRQDAEPGVHRRPALRGGRVPRPRAGSVVRAPRRSRHPRRHDDRDLRGPRRDHDRARRVVRPRRSVRLGDARPADHPLTARAAVPGRQPGRAHRRDAHRARDRGHRRSGDVRRLRRAVVAAPHER